MPKVIKSGVREVVLRVKEFFIKEREHSTPLIPFERVNERVAAATGVSLRTVTRIASERRLAEASSSKIVTSGKKRKTRKDKLLLDNNSDIGVLQRKLKRKVAQVNIGKPMFTCPMPEMVGNSFNAISSDKWCNYCSRMKKLEEYQLKSGYINEDSDKRLLDIVHAEHNYSK